MADGPGLKPYEEDLRRQGCRYVAGIDEAGRGPLAGPVVAAAVILPSPCRIQGLKDSKALSPSRRLEFYRLIQREAVAVAVGVVPENVIDGINILQATHQAMRQAAARLSVPPDHILVDGRPVPGFSSPHTAVVGGDRLCASIAAASIVAKVHRDALMEAYSLLYPAYGFDRHKGYGTVEHLAALAHFGPCSIHRRTFNRVRQYCLPAEDRHDAPAPRR